MAGLVLFRALHFLAIENFFDREACERMRVVMRDAPSDTAMIGVAGTIDEKQRRTRVVAVPPELHRMVVERFNTAAALR